MTTLASLLHPAYEVAWAPGEEIADGAQLVDGQWWHPIFGCDSLQYVVDNARQALARLPHPLHPAAALPSGADPTTQRGSMKQSEWLNIAICAWLRERHGGGSTTADLLDGVGCPGAGIQEDGQFDWAYNCADCLRRVRPDPADGVVEPPPIIAFECELRIEPST
jgi:hypothetical protein